MTREKVIDIMQRAALRLGRYHKFTQVRWQCDELVVYKGKQYYPDKLMFNFDRHQTVHYTCLIHDLRANSVVEVKIEDLEECFENGQDH